MINLLNFEDDVDHGTFPLSVVQITAKPRFIGVSRHYLERAANEGMRVLYEAGFQVERVDDL